MYLINQLKQLNVFENKSEKTCLQPRTLTVDKWVFLELSCERNLPRRNCKQLIGLETINNFLSQKYKQKFYKNFLVINRTLGNGALFFCWKFFSENCQFSIFLTFLKQNKTSKVLVFRMNQYRWKQGQDLKNIKSEHSIQFDENSVALITTLEIEIC